jgi:hypothetical protein
MLLVIALYVPAMDEERMERIFAVLRHYGVSWEIGCRVDR